MISPLLANLYLHLLDRLRRRQHLQRRLEARLVRYADDFVYPNRLVYEKYGLFKVPTTAGWTRAHALR